MTIDWGDGTYEDTAATLRMAAEAGVEALGIASGERVLDLGCGTGNAALLAATKGAKVTAIDPSSRLVDVAAARAREARLTLDARVGVAGDIPADSDAFDAVVSIFAVIFAPDPEEATREMVRVTRPGGRIVLTSWVPRGPIAESGKILRAAMTALAPPPDPAAPPPPWGDQAAMRALFERHGARVSTELRSLQFTSTSAGGWFDEQEANHPMWRSARRALPAETWADVRTRSVAALAAGNLAPDRFVVESEYFLVKAVLG